VKTEKELERQYKMVQGKLASRDPDDTLRRIYDQAYIDALEWVRS
jgi:hypothetical protein